jgi:MFS family permease
VLSFNVYLLLNHGVTMDKSIKDLQYWKFSTYGFLKNLRFFDPFIVLFFLDTGLSFLEIGLLISFREIIINVLEVPSGISADSLGRRKSMILSFSAYIVSFAIFFISKQFYTHLAAMFFYGIGEAFRSGTHKAMILEYLRSKNLLHLKVHYYGHTRSWSQMGSAFSAVLAGVIVFFSPGYRYVFIFSIIPYIIGLFLLWTYPKNLDFSHNNTANNSQEKIGFKLRLKTTLTELLVMLKKKKTRRAIINASVFDAVFKSIKDYLQPVLLALIIGFPVLLKFENEEKISVLSAFVYFVLYVLTSFAAKLSGKFSNLFRTNEKGLNFTFITGFLLIFVIGISLFTELNILPVILFIFFYLLQNLRKPIIIGLLSSRIPASAMASGLSVESQAKTLLVAVLAPGMGLLMDTLGIGRTFIIFAVFLALIYPIVRLKEEIGTEKK